MITPKQAAAQLKRMANPRPLHREVANAFRRAGRRIEKRAEDRFTTKGIGRRLFGRKKAGARKLFSLGRVKTQGDTVSADLTVKGLAAIQEEGGRVSAHVIKPKNAPKMIFMVKGRLIVTAKPVQHPGASHPPMPSLAPEIEAGIPDIQREIEEAVARHVDQSMRA